MADSFVTVGTSRIAVDIRGSNGPTVVLLHGIPGWRGTWQAVAGHLCAAHRTVAPDLLGFGDSDAPHRTLHARGQAHMVIGLLDALGLDEVHLVGFDFGGPTAVLAAHLAPRRMASLTLMATNLFTDTPVPGPLGIARVPFLGALAFRIGFSRPGLMALWPAAVGDRRAFPFARYCRTLRSRNGVASTRRTFFASLRDLRGLYAEVEEAASSLSLPSLVLWGDRDPFFPLPVGERTAAAVRASRFIPLPGCGHFVPEERAAEAAAAVAELVASATRASGRSGRTIIDGAADDLSLRTGRAV